jgi:hypothetical protein
MMRRAVIWKRWQDVVGEQVAGMAWPFTFRDRDILVVAVADSAWMHHMSYLKPDILDRLNGFLEEGGRLSDIRFVIDDVKRVRRETAIGLEDEGEPGLSHAALPSDQLKRAEELASGVSDPGLRKALHNLYLSNAAHHILKE